MDLFLWIEDQETGPFPEAEVRAMVRDGRIARDGLAWRDGMADWQALSALIVLPPPPAPPPRPPPPLSRPASASSIPAGLPPLPPAPRSRPQATPATSHGPTVARSTTIRTVSGVIALLLGVLTVFNVGGCINAKSKLTAFQRGDDPAMGVNMLVETYRGANAGDPLRGVAGLLNKSSNLREELEGFQVGAWLCLTGLVVAGVVFLGANARRT